MIDTADYCSDINVGCCSGAAGTCRDGCREQARAMMDVASTAVSTLRGSGGGWQHTAGACISLVTSGDLSFLPNKVSLQLHCIFRLKDSIRYCI